MTRKLFDRLGEPGVYVALAAAAPPIDGTAAWAAVNTLTLGALPYVPHDSQWLGTIQIGAAGYRDYPASIYPHSYVAPTLTVVNSVFDAADSYLVLWLGQNKSYDPALEALQVVVVGGTTPVISTWDCTAAEGISDTVYNLAGVARQANAGAVGTMPVIGMILSKPDATHAVVVSFGDLVGVLAGLTPGAWYYADIVNGGITTTVPTLGGGFVVLQAVGYAKTATDFVVDRQPKIDL